MTRLILASGSPRRKELLAALGVEYQVIPSTVDEDKAPRSGETPEAFAERLAMTKADSVAEGHADQPVLGADTIVVVDGDTLGKPADAAEAEGMLRRLRGREHRVITGVAVVHRARGLRLAASAATAVRFREYSDAEIRAYIASGAPMDKAGAYGVQDFAFHPAAQVIGCLQNVVGLPCCLATDLLEGAGVAVKAAAAEYKVPEACRLASCRFASAR